MLAVGGAADARSHRAGGGDLLHQMARGAARLGPQVSADASLPTRAVEPISARSPPARMPANEAGTPPSLCGRFDHIYASWPSWPEWHLWGLDKPPALIDYRCVCCLPFDCGPAPTPPQTARFPARRNRQRTYPSNGVNSCVAQDTRGESPPSWYGRYPSLRKAAVCAPACTGDDPPSTGWQAPPAAQQSAGPLVPEPNRPREQGSWHRGCAPSTPLRLAHAHFTWTRTPRRTPFLIWQVATRLQAALERK